MKIDNKSLKFANGNIRNKTPPIPFYVPDSEKKLSPLDYQTCKLQTIPKDKKLAVYNLVVKYYKVRTSEEWLQFMEVITQVIKVITTEKPRSKPTPLSKPRLKPIVASEFIRTNHQVTKQGVSH
eukprot:428821-Ditylum_brightwellii.AAC.1